MKGGQTMRKEMHEWENREKTIFIPQFLMFWPDSVGWYIDPPSQWGQKRGSKKLWNRGANTISLCGPKLKPNGQPGAFQQPWCGIMRKTSDVTLGVFCITLKPQRKPKTWIINGPESSSALKQTDLIWGFSLQSYSLSKPSIMFWWKALEGKS